MVSYKKICIVISILAAVSNVGYAQNLKTLFSYNRPIAANSKKDFTLDLKGKSYTSIRIEGKVDRQDVLLFCKTDTMHSYDRVSPMPMPILYGHMYHKDLFSLSASLPGMKAKSVHVLLENKGTISASVQLSIYGMTP